MNKDDMLCSKSHEYVVKDGDKFVVGLTDYAVEQLGDIVFLELPEVGSEFSKGETFANIESVKAASEIYMPISGKIAEIHEELIDAPEKLNEDWFEGGWLVKIEANDAEADSQDLMSYNDYKAEVE